MSRSNDHGAKSLEQLVRQVIDKPLAKRGFQSADMISQWDGIVGAEIAAKTEPKQVKLGRGKAAKGGVLEVTVDPSALLEAPMWKPMILEKVNLYLGLGAISEVKFTPGPVAPPATRHKKPEIKEAKTLDEALERLAQNSRARSE